MTRTALSASAVLVLAAGALPAQVRGPTDLFDRDPIYEQTGTLRGKGEIPFFADVSFLQGRADSSQAVLGIALSNQTFQFVKEDDGYRAAYEVELRIRGDRGSFRNTWREEVRVRSFDETIVDRETVVFQSEFGLLPGTYDLDLEVRDRQSGQTGKVETALEVPAMGAPASGYALTEPVLLRYFTPAGDGGREHVLFPSHYYSTSPQEVPFFVEIYPGAEARVRPAKLVATVAPEREGVAAAPLSTTPIDVPSPEGGGSTTRIYGNVPGQGMEAGVYRLTVSLQDASGATLAESFTRLSLSAVTQWVEKNWEEAVEMVSYEANEDEREDLEKAPAGSRIDAWNDFWSVRDPVPATPANEAFETYFQRIATANASFGSKLRPGWKSDRGRVYVAFGPPNDVIRRPVNSGSFPLEVWTYDVPGFQIAFEDRIGFGNYQMANPGTFANELAALERRRRRAIEERRAQREGRISGGEGQKEGRGGEGATGSDPGDSSGAAADTTGATADSTRN
ncbi:MAG: GWxTD domain-containing protein [Gemmatimonadetes bacterium]|nr:GWxTD domain-containing protein [Gemmatimonadota bacterium]